MDDPVAHEHIWCHDLGTVDINITVIDVDRHILPAQGLETGAVGEMRAVADRAVDD